MSEADYNELATFLLDSFTTQEPQDFCRFNLENALLDNLTTQGLAKPIQDMTEADYNELATSLLDSLREFLGKPNFFNNSKEEINELLAPSSKISESCSDVSPIFALFARKEFSSSAIASSCASVFFSTSKSSFRHTRSSSTLALACVGSKVKLASNLTLTNYADHASLKLVALTEALLLFRHFFPDGALRDSADLLQQEKLKEVMKVHSQALSFAAQRFLSNALPLLQYSIAIEGGLTFEQGEKKRGFKMVGTHISKPQNTGETPKIVGQKRKRSKSGVTDNSSPQQPSCTKPEADLPANGQDVLHQVQSAIAQLQLQNQEQNQRQQQLEREINELTKLNSEKDERIKNLEDRVKGLENRVIYPEEENRQMDLA